VDCRDVQNLLHPYLDGELDLVRHLQIEHHLAECAACAERNLGLQRLRETITAAPLYHRAPAALRARLQAAPAPLSTDGRPRWRIRVAFAATAAAALLCGVAVVPWSGAAAENRLVAEVVAGHVRSLQAEHLTDVASSDRHTVKPWFRGRLDFSPPVPDLAPQGYPLSGGRLDYLSDRPVAALVYGRRQHVINLFLWPAATDDERAVRPLSRQGFHVRTWRQSGMTYWAISDLNPQELDEFVRLFREQAQPASP